MATQPTRTKVRAAPPAFTEPKPISLDQERLRILVYGDPKVGKTTFAMTAPRPLIVNTDAGLISAAVQAQQGLNYEPKGYRDLEGFYVWAKEHRDQYDSIIIDDLTTLQRLLLDELHDQNVASKDDVKPIMQWTPEQGEYQANQRQVARILTDLRRIPGKHMIAIAGVRDRMGRRSPDVAPGMAAIVLHWASVIGELIKVPHHDNSDDGPQPRQLLLGGAGRDAGSRFRSLEGVGVMNPTFDKLWNRVQKEYKESEARAAKAAAINKEQSA